MDAKIRKRYMTDLTFNRVVDTMADALDRGDITKQDLTVAASLAVEIHTERTRAK